LDLRTWPRYHLGVFKGFENKLIFLEISTGWNNSFKIGSFYFTWNRILFLSKYFLSKGFEGFAQRIWLKLFLYSFYFKYGSKCSNSQVSKRQEINLIFKIKVFVGSKIWYFNKFHLILFSKNLGCYNLPPLKRISSRDSQIKIEIDWEMRLPDKRCSVY
jgi:hypothetical protein